MRTPHCIAPILAALMACITPTGARAQDSPPADGAESGDDDVESRIDELGRRAPRAVEVAPVERIGDPDSLRPPRGRLVREGAFLTRRRGRIVPLASGQWVYLFDADEQGEAEPPMILGRGLRLTEMVRITEARSDTVTFVTSGEVFVYRNRNYFMAESFTTISTPVERSAGAAGAREEADRDAIEDLIRGFSTEDDPGSPGDPADPTVSELLEPFSVRREERRVSAGAPARTGDQPANLRREGTMLVLQRGHVRQNDQGWWSLVIDNDVDAAPGAADRALILQPCLLLEEIERLVRTHGEQLALRLSGRVFVYDGENYLLPTMFVVDFDRSGNLVPAQ